LILVTTGFHNVPFDRLIQWAEQIATGNDFSESFFIQKGGSKIEPANCDSIDFIPMDTFSSYLQRSKCVITHGGTGSIMTSLMAGKKPIVVPRLKRFGEVCNNHQLEIAREFEKKGWVYVATNSKQLRQHIKQQLNNGHSTKYSSNNSKLLNIIGDCLNSIEAGKFKRRSLLSPGA
jgi:UDP-N-acetylglucosamine transferase subunit ALG13